MLFSPPPVFVKVAAELFLAGVHLPLFLASISRSLRPTNDLPASEATRVSCAREEPGAEISSISLQYRERGAVGLHLTFINSLSLSFCLSFHAVQLIVWGLRMLHTLQMYSAPVKRHLNIYLDYSNQLDQSRTLMIFSIRTFSYCDISV